MLRVLPWRAGQVLVGGVVCALLLSGCFRQASRPSGQEPSRLPAGALFAPRASFTFAVLLPPKAEVPTLSGLEQLIAQRFQPLRLVGSAGPELLALPTVEVTERQAQEYPLPEGEYMELAARHLSPQELGRLAAFERILLLEFTTEPPALEALRQAHALALELARSSGGLLWDEEVGEFHSPDTWQQRRLEEWEAGEPLLANHFNTHTFSDGQGNEDLATVGLGKFGLPDLGVREVPEPLTGRVGSLINLVAQLMLEGAEVREDGTFLVAFEALKFTSMRQYLQQQAEPGAPQRLVLGLSPIEPDESGRDNRFVELLFPAHLGASPSERPYAALAELFGARNEIISTEHDEELMAASNRAREALLHRVKPRFQEGLEPGARLFVKAPFDTASGGSEWMWLHVTGWEGASIRGILDSEPEDVPHLRAGSPVSVPEEEVFDYFLLWADGSTEGNQTERIILERARKR